jgi:hypothetical protein
VKNAGFLADNRMERSPVHVDVFLIGAPKAGTTAVAAALAKHPDVCFSDPKEPNCVATYRSTFGRDDSHPNWAQYEQCFAARTGIRIDGSVCVFADPDAPTRYAVLYPDAKFLVCVRDPVARALSHWAMITDSAEDLEHGIDWKTFERAWSDKSLYGHSLYGENLARWLNYFPREKFLFVTTEDMVSDPGGVLEVVTAFCGVDPMLLRASCLTKENAAIARRSQARGWNKARLAFRRIAPNVRLPRLLSTLAWKAFERRGRVPQVDAYHYEICRSRVLPDLAYFSLLAGLDVARWVRKFRGGTL